MVSGPEMARVIVEFQATAKTRMKKTEFQHHEQTKHTQIAFAWDVTALTGVIGEIGNPFCDDSKELLVLEIINLSDSAVTTDPIKRNNLPLFSRPPVKERSRTQLQVSSLKNDCSLFSRLFIASQTRDGDFEFFLHMGTRLVPLHCRIWARWDSEQNLIWLSAWKTCFLHGGRRPLALLLQ